MINLLPRDTVFYDLFEGMSRHVVRAAEDLRQLAQNFPEITQYLQRIREEEHAADELAHQALDRLDRTFITPFDREDIHDLVGELDSARKCFNCAWGGSGAIASLRWSRLGTSSVLG